MGYQNTQKHRCDEPACKKGHCLPGSICEVHEGVRSAFYAGMMRPDGITASHADIITLECMRELQKMHQDN